MKNNTITSERLKECRIAAGYKKQEDVAKILNVQRQIISYYETGERKPNIDDLVKLAKLYNTSTDYLLGLSDVATSDVNIKSICEYTGLSESAIKELNNSKKLKDKYYHILKNEADLHYLDIINWILTDANMHNSIMSMLGYKVNLLYLLQDQKVLLKYLDSTDFIATNFSDKYSELQLQYKDVRFHLFEALEKCRAAITKDSDSILNEYIKNDKILNEKNEYYAIQFFKNKYESSDS